MTYKVIIIKAENSAAEIHTFESKPKYDEIHSVTGAPAMLVKLLMAGTLIIQLTHECTRR